MGSLILADPQQQRLLARLRDADAPVTFAELRASGIHFPAAVVSELQLGGYAFEHVREQGRMAGVRLVESDRPSLQPSARATVRRARRIRPHRPHEELVPACTRPTLPVDTVRSGLASGMVIAPWAVTNNGVAYPQPEVTEPAEPVNFRGPPD